MVALLISMLKTTIPPKKLIPKRLRVDDSEVNRFSVSKNGIKHVRKSEKLSKSEKSKCKKMFKSRNLAKSRKKLSKSENSTNFNSIRDGPKFLTPDASIAFNCL